MNNAVKSFAKMSPNMILLLVVVAAGSGGEQEQCDRTHVSAPKPRLRYMLNGDLNVAWRQNVADASKTSYTANYCCKKPPPSYNAKCPHVCPNHTVLHSCYQKELNTFEVEYSCTFVPKQYIQYLIFLTDDTRGCHFKGDAVKIEPTLQVAHAFDVAYVNMTLKKDEKVQLDWDTRHKNAHNFQMCYFVTCQYADSNNRTKTIRLENIATRSAVVSFPSRSTVFTSYTCCVKVRDCAVGSFSDETCSQGELPTSGAVNSSTYNYRSNGLLISFLVLVLQR